MKMAEIPEGVPVYSVSFGGPFMGRYGRAVFEYGPTVGELVAAMPGLPEGFLDRGEVRLNDHVVIRDHWHRIRPKPGAADRPVYLTLHMAPRGGGDSGSSTKSIVAIVAAIALTVATAGIATGALAGLGGVFAAGGIFAGGTIGANVLALGVGLAGQLAVTALTKPPTPAEDSGKTRGDVGTASADGNLADPGGALPRVIGSVRVFPPFVNDAFYEVIDNDEYVTVVMALAGPHKLEQIRLGDAAIEDSEDIEVETREGWDTDTPLALITRQCRVSGSQMELSMHVRNTDTSFQLADQVTPTNSLPKWHTIASRYAPDQFRIRLDFPEGICDTDSDESDFYYMVPFHARFRLRGSSTWFNTPEFWIGSRNPDPRKAEVIFDWSGSEPAVPTPPGNRGAVLSWRTTPTQTSDPIGIGGWQAHPYFSDMSKEPQFNNNNLADTGVLHTHMAGEGITFYLDPNLFPKGTYEVQLKRGIAIRPASLTNDYVFHAQTVDFFGYVLDIDDNAKVPEDDENRFSRCFVLRGTSVWNEHPIAKGGDALLALRAKNRAITSISVLASGYVPDWDGSAWTGAVTTSNPAPHYRYVLTGGLNLDPLPEDLVGEDMLVDWRQDCIDHGYTCNTIIQGERVQDSLNLIASCAYARPYQSEVWGVVVDRDTSANPPSNVFTTRNMAGFRFEKAFTRLPDGLRVTYRSSDADDTDQQALVFRDPDNPGSNYEQVTYDGMTDEGAVRARAAFDLAQAVERATFYYGTAAGDAFTCRRGDLVGLVHDVINAWMGSARVKAKIVSGGNITGVVLDSEMPANGGDLLAPPDLLDVDDLLGLGTPVGMTIRHADGTFSIHRIQEVVTDSATVMFETPFADASVTIHSGHGSEVVDSVGEAEEGALVSWGAVDEEFKRVLVFAISPADEGTYGLTFVDEAPGLTRTPVAAFTPPGGISINAAGPYAIVVPNYEHSLVVDLIGGSGGSMGINTSTYAAGTDGGATTFQGMTAGGSLAPTNHSTGSAGGIASGGDTNTNGNPGANPTGTTASGVGGAAPGGGAGGAAVTTNGNGLPGGAPGGGASGSFRTGNPTCGSGSGARCQKTYAPGALTPGDILIVSVGAGGLEGDGGQQNGAPGQRGEARFTWS